jgi:hypothetical protein
VVQKGPPMMHHICPARSLCDALVQQMISWMDPYVAHDAQQMSKTLLVWSVCLYITWHPGRIYMWSRRVLLWCTINVQKDPCVMHWESRWHSGWKALCGMWCTTNLWDEPCVKCLYITWYHPGRVLLWCTIRIQKDPCGIQLYNRWHPGWTAHVAHDAQETSEMTLMCLYILWLPERISMWSRGDPPMMHNKPPKWALSDAHVLQMTLWTDPYVAHDAQ